MCVCVWMCVLTAVRPNSVSSATVAAMSRLVLLAMGAAIGVSVHMSLSHFSVPVPVVPTVPAAVDTTVDAAVAHGASSSGGAGTPTLRQETVDPLPVQLKDLPALRDPQPLQFVSPEEATDEWRHHINRYYRDSRGRFAAVAVSASWLRIADV